MKTLIALLVSITTVPLLTAEDATIDLEPHVVHSGDQSLVAVEQEVPMMPASLVREQGWVVMQFRVSESGRVSDIKVVDSTDEKLAKYCRGMVRDWEYERLNQSVVAVQPVFFEASRSTPILYAMN